ncbi:MAG: ribonuclease H [Candidatus Andersenbacteria bacterium CG10_big_fil_rev_8_21_14_0_10_54_11]|uniref:Ribonuclease H n=1 Tax=Candidatus Andersenbacteria bacterium CG10_big_fil_rev_8_21_14_0_10_54_11 TaxID=1974485 RepID=A0A2M6WYZ8_9BACT|nr:MAG: ribonuclease H [Candidatus Andersenbacteria bacterium CG10_big_fil_rev_8_21_14_0_10_54_11]
MKGVLHTDGGARGNPGPAGIGFVLQIGRREILAGEYIGETTNNQAEYRALLGGLQRALAEGVTELQCYIDSELVVKQLAGQYRVKDIKLKPLYKQVCELVDRFARVSFTHVRREKNKVADKLVNEAIDRRFN